MYCAPSSQMDDREKITSHGVEPWTIAVSDSGGSSAISAAVTAGWVRGSSRNQL
jgi:hypothetical protein